MRFTPFAIVAACLLVSCQKEAKISGKPVSEWVERLEDYDERTQVDAANRLLQVDANALKGSRRNLLRIAQSRNDQGGAWAAEILQKKFGTGLPKWAGVYIYDLESDITCQGALRRCFIEDRDQTEYEIIEWIEVQTEELERLADGASYRAELQQRIDFANQFWAQLQEDARNGDL